LTVGETPRILRFEMRIAQVSPLFESVPPRAYGGTERVVSYLTEELVARGHAVTLFASGDSKTSARLVPGAPRSIRNEAQDFVALHMGMLLEVYARAREFDVIHCHTDYISLPFTARSPVATVLTPHGRLDIPEVHPVYRAFPEVALTSISDAQRLPLAGVHWAATVHHGLPPDLYRFRPEAGKHLLFLGRISPEKCPDMAIRVAIRSGVPLRIAAKVDKADQLYFEQVVRPMLDHPLVEWLSEVDDGAKEQLLGEAIALIFPIDWPEPFGMVMIESLACGTPVISRRRGSVPEVIVDGQTGFMCETEDEMVAAVARVTELRRRACRAEFDARFTAGRMAERYLRVYELEFERRRRGRKRTLVAREEVPVAGTA
jgi:glycosyltransferase involved in cell wall biosynthesis